MTNTTLTREEAIAKARARKQAKLAEANQALLANDNIMDQELARLDRAENIQSMETVVTSINNLPTIQLNGYGKVSMNVFATGAVHFGAELSLVLGLIAGYRGAFLEEHRDAVNELMNVDLAFMEDLIDAVGSPAYYSTKHLEVIEDLPGDFETASALLVQLAEKMELHQFDMSKFTEQAYTNWFKNERLKAEVKASAQEKINEINETEEFTLS